MRTPTVYILRGHYHSFIGKVASFLIDGWLTQYGEREEEDEEDDWSSDDVSHPFQLMQGMLDFSSYVTELKRSLKEWQEDSRTSDNEPSNTFILGITEPNSEVVNVIKQIFKEMFPEGRCKFIEMTVKGDPSVPLVNKQFTEEYTEYNERLLYV